MSVVYKFGGSTIKDAKAIKKIADVITNAKALQFVVVSATYNSTNELEEIAATALSHDLKDELVESFIDKHQQLAQELDISDQVAPYLESYKNELQEYCSQVVFFGELRESDLDAIYSIGERLSSILLFTYLQELKFPCELLDARDLIVTNRTHGSALPLFKLCQQNYSKLTAGKVFITQGFIGRTLEGVTTTLGREGSDYTASILANISKASEVVLWKDVDGIYQFDPKLLATAKKIEEISYRNAEKLTEKGSKILFPSTMQPLIEKGIPLIVKSIHHPEMIGTRITATCQREWAALALKEINEEEVTLTLIGRELSEEELKVFSSYLELELYEYSRDTFALKFKKHDLKQRMTLFADFL